jgi:hypothetical protein
MFILTKEKSLRGRDIIGVFDLDTATISSVTKNFLASAEKSGEVKGTNNLPKSFILADHEGVIRIYLSSRLAGYINK